MNLNKITNEARLLIAPCGMNCGICIGYMREKNKCDGCFSDSDYKPTYCKSCIIKNCEHIKASASGFCFDCQKFPCKRLKQLDKRYRNKYHMSMLDNLSFIKEFGIDEFLKREDQKWSCPTCHARVSAHRDNCLKCGKELYSNS